MRKIVPFWFLYLLTFSLSAQQFDFRARCAQHLFNQEYIEAIRLTDSILNADSSAVWAWYYKGRAELELLRYRDARTSFQKAGEYYPDSIPVLTGIGNAANALGDMPLTIRTFNKILMLDSTRISARIALARAYAKYGKLSDAIAEYKHLLGFDEYNFAYHKELGLVYLKADSIDRGIWHLHDAINLNNHDLPLAFQLSNLYIRQHQLELARAVATLGLRADSTYTPLHRTEGYIAYLLKQYPSALRNFENCLIFGDSSLFVRKYLGYTLFNLEKFDNALPWLISVYQADSTAPEHAYYLGLTWENLKAYRKANKYLKTALRLYEPPPELVASIYREIGNNYYSVNDWVNAYENYRNALEIKPENSTLLYSMGVLCEEHLNNKPKALQYYDAIVRQSELDREMLENWGEQKVVPLPVIAYRRMKRIREEMHFEGKLKK